MKQFDADGPVARFLGDAFDFFMIFVLTFFLSIPIVTAGAAMTAGSYVSMKIMRKEAPSLFPAYFKAFRDNFKQATLLWLIQFAFIAFLLYDWMVMILYGWNYVNLFFKLTLIFASVLVILVNLTLYPVIARFAMKSRDIMKTTFFLAFKYSWALLLVLLPMAGAVYGCIRLYRLLPLFVAVGAVGITSLHGFVMMKICATIEGRFPKITEPEGEDEDSSVV